MKNTTTLLLALATLAAVPSAAAVTDSAPAPDGADRLAVCLFSAEFLAEVAARIEANRIDSERLTDAYLQEKTGLIWARQDNGKGS